MVDTLVLETSAERRESSSLTVTTKFYGALSVVACTSCCDLESMSSILIEHPKDV